MKITKLLSTAAAAVVAATALAATASAEYVIYDDVQPWIDQSASNYLVILYSTGTAPDDVKAVDLGLTVEDVGRIASATFTFAVEDSWDMMDLDYGGCIGSSAHECVNYPGGSDLYSKYNWVTGEWYGFVDEDLGIDTQDVNKSFVTTKVGDLTYSISGTVTNAVAEGDLDDLTSFRVFCADWGIMSETTMLKSEFFDASGNLLLELDGKGNIVSTVFGSSDSSADAAEADATDAADTADDTPAPAATDSKGSPDTGVEGVAAVAGLAVVAAGAVALSRKRK